ncbi:MULTISPECIES: 3-isopropylmalate dehydrogenase [unclassified Prochlorococcus]|uniref:3-isopropylmalate dehydrogenase n=1 Tax=unclassified Prochlorococcus TaxID=2627481 RepID=UPI000533A0A1|nr:MULTISPECIES: 3-isopropylmalate dehydrogenase [unclassified Prochlorococcus]KGG15179.1 3-isopropylmalate dehydrogenase [Prochlorococcus sp. MIT 0602]KGG17453.1 3-isopropylmalate dehydrogenase [Prochlorococcus sp. MIT 0603]
MGSHKIIILSGDGIGPEISSVTQAILRVVCQKHGISLNFEEKHFGGRAIDATGNPLPEDTLRSCKNSDAILLAAIGDPKYDSLPRESRPETGLLKLRSELDLFANIRPVKIIKALIESSSLKKEVIEDVDLVVVRELTGGIYFGQPKGRIKTEEAGERAFNTMVYSSHEIDRIAKIAFDLAATRKRKVCSIDKANVLDVSQLWRERVTIAAKQYQDIDLNHQYVDNAAMQLVRNPAQFDVILTSNLFGDIISDEAAMLTGSIGMLPSASLGGSGPGVFEPVHGSAPDIANKDFANPIAMILSAAMMLRIGLKEKDAAQDLEDAVEKVLSKGIRTLDIFSKSSELKVGCKKMGQEIINVLEDSE